MLIKQTSYVGRGNRMTKPVFCQRCGKALKKKYGQQRSGHNERIVGGPDIEICHKCRSR